LRILVMTNGEYGDPGWYGPQRESFDRVICVDGGTTWAMRLGMVPDRVVGDLDSISPEALDYAAGHGAEFTVVPREKDNTDTQLALELAERDGATGVVIWGGTGSRLDHSLSNLFSASSLVLKGIAVQFASPREDIYLIDRSLVLPARVGETVSLIALGDEALGVTLSGFKYPLFDARINGRWQHAVSNVVVAENPAVRVASGVLAVIHYRELPE